MNQNPANSQNPEQPPASTKKKPRQTFTLKPEHFQKQNGLQSLYKAIQKLDLNKGQDNVEASMKKIIVLLKTWHFQMIPRYSFQLFLQRCRALGNHKFTQSYMTKVRRIHKGEDDWGNQQQNKNDPLNSLNLNHLNPNTTQQQQQKELEELNLDQKIQRAMKIVNETSYRANQSNQNKESKKMQVEQIRQGKGQLESASQDDDQCDELLRQMDRLEKEKKQLFSNGKMQNQQTFTQNDKEEQKGREHQEKEKAQIVHNEESQQVPYVPQGFDVDYGEESDEYRYQ